MTAEIKLPPFPEGLCLREDYGFGQVGFEDGCTRSIYPSSEFRVRPFRLIALEA